MFQLLQYNKHFFFFFRWSEITVKCADTKVTQTHCFHCRQTDHVCSRALSSPKKTSLILEKPWPAKMKLEQINRHGQNSTLRKHAVMFFLQHVSRFCNLWQIFVCQCTFCVYFVCTRVIHETSLSYKPINSFVSSA